MLNEADAVSNVWRGDAGRATEPPSFAEVVDPPRRWEEERCHHEPFRASQTLLRKKVDNKVKTTAASRNP